MSISVTISNQHTIRDKSGVPLRRGSLTLTGLTAATGNTIPHGLPFTPKRVSLRPGANGGWGETQVPDTTNIYVTVGSGGATAGTIDYCEG